jgi:hypothetical protein
MQLLLAPVFPTGQGLFKHTIFHNLLGGPFKNCLQIKYIFSAQYAACYPTTAINQPQETHFTTASYIAAP